MKRFLFVIFFVALSLIPSAKSEAATLRTPSTLASGLIGWWTFDGRDMWGGVVRDRSASGNNGSLLNIATSTFYAEGKIGQGARLDGDNDYVTLGSISLGTNAYSVSFWAKRGTIIGAWGTAFGLKASFSDALWVYEDGDIGFGDAGASDWTRLNTNSWTDKIGWHHVVMVVPAVGGASSITVYFDGVAIGTGTGGTSNSWNSPTLGRFASAHDTEWLGSFDDVRIYNRALSAIEVTQLYRYGSAKIAESKSPGSLASGLVGHWTFDGGDLDWTTARATDKSGRSNNANMFSFATSTSIASGITGQALTFNGATNYVNVNTPSGFPTGASPISYSVWVKPPAIASPGVIFYYGTNATLQSYYIDVRCAPNTFSAGRWGSQLHCDTSTYTPGQWYHLALTYDGTTSRFYKNGVFINSAAVTLSLVNTYASIGRYSGGEYFPGLIDDVRVYNRQLSDEEVERLYNLGQPTKTAATVVNKNTLSTGLVSHWTFDGKDTWGGVLRDRIGDHNAQLNNIASSTFYGAGIIGQAGYFDGSNDFATTSAHSVLNGVSTLTVAGWANLRTSTSRGSIFNRWTSATNWLNLQFWISNQVNVTVANGTTPFGTFSTGVGTVPPRTQWNHYAMVFDGTQTGNANRLKAYVNGELVTLAFTGTIPATAPTMTNNDRIGYDTHNSLSLDGAADDIRVYSRALSQEEVKALYRMGR